MQLRTSSNTNPVWLSEINWSRDLCTVCLWRGAARTLQNWSRVAVLAWQNFKLCQGSAKFYSQAFGYQLDQIEWSRRMFHVIDCVQICSKLCCDRKGLSHHGIASSRKLQGSLGSLSLKWHCWPQLHVIGLNPHKWRQYCKVWVLMGG